MSWKSGILIFIMLLTVPIYVPLVSALNTTAGDNPAAQTPAPTASSGTPFITIDPIGNHTIGDVFFIDGTTNLPVAENLTINIYNFRIYGCAVCNHQKTASCGDLDSPSGGAEISDISISTDRSGTNRWSINITDTAKEFVSGVYIFHVCSGQICNSGGAFDGVCNEVRPTESYPANDYFTLFPAANATPITSPQKIIQSPSPIQPPASAGTIVPITTQSSPLPVVWPIIVFVSMVILRVTIVKKR